MVALSPDLRRSPRDPVPVLDPVLALVPAPVLVLDPTLKTIWLSA